MNNTENIYVRIKNAWLNKWYIAIPALIVVTVITLGSFTNSLTIFRNMLGSNTPLTPSAKQVMEGGTYTTANPDTQVRVKRIWRDEDNKDGEWWAIIDVEYPGWKKTDIRVNHDDEWDFSYDNKVFRLQGYVRSLDRLVFEVVLIDISP